MPSGSEGSEQNHILVPISEPSNVVLQGSLGVILQSPEPDFKNVQGSHKMKAKIGVRK